METGEAILSYKGNDALGYGADGIAYAGDATNAITNFNRIFDNAASRNFQWNTIKYQQAVKDRDAMLDMLQQSKGMQDMPVDEEDRKILNGKYDAVKEMVFDHPTLSNYEKMARMQVAITDLQNSSAAAKTRYAQFTNMRNEIAADTNQASRQRRLDWLAQQKNTDIFHIPDPYMKPTDFDDKTLFPDAPVKVIDEKMINDNGILKKQTTTRPDIKWMIDHYLPTNVLHGDMSDQIGAFYDFATTDPTVKSNEYLANGNQLLMDANKENGFKEGDKYFLDPLAKQDENGNYVPVGNKVDFAKKMYIIKGYKTTTTAPVYDEAAQKAHKMLSEQKENEAQASASRAEANLRNTEAGIKKMLAPFEQDKLQAEAEKLRREGKKAEYEMTKDEMSVAKPVSDALQSWSNIENLSTYKPAAQVLPASIKGMPGVSDFLKNLGVDDNTMIAPIPLTNQTAMRMTSRSGTTEKGKTVVVKPIAMYSIRPDADPDHISIIGIDKNGTVTTSGFSEGINNIIGYEGGFQNKDNVKLQSAAKRYINRVEGADYGDVSYSRLKQRFAQGPVSNEMPVTSVKASASGTNLPQGTQVTPPAVPQMQQQQTPAAAIPTGSSSIQIKGAQVKKMDGKVKAYYKGRWRNVVSKDQANGVLNLE